MIKAVYLISGGDLTLARELELKIIMRGVIRSFGGNHIEVKFKRRLYHVVAPTSGGIKVRYKSTGREVETLEKRIAVLEKLAEQMNTGGSVVMDSTAEDGPKTKRKTAKRRRKMSSKLDMD